MKNQIHRKLEYRTKHDFTVSIDLNVYDSINLWLNTGGLHHEAYCLTEKDVEKMQEMIDIYKKNDTERINTPREDIKDYKNEMLENITSNLTKILNDKYGENRPPEICLEMLGSVVESIDNAKGCN